MYRVNRLVSGRWEHSFALFLAEVVLRWYQGIRIRFNNAFHKPRKQDRPTEKSFYDVISCLTGSGSCDFVASS